MESESKNDIKSLEKRLVDLQKQMTKTRVKTTRPAVRQRVAERRKKIRGDIQDIEKQLQELREISETTSLDAEIKKPTANLQDLLDSSGNFSESSRMQSN